MEFVSFLAFVACLCALGRVASCSGTAYDGTKAYQIFAGSKNGRNSNSWPAVTVSLTSERLIVMPARKRWPRRRFAPTFLLARTDCGQLRVRRRALYCWLFVSEEERIAIVPPRWAPFSEAWETLGWPDLVVETTVVRRLLDRWFPRLRYQ